MARDEKLRPAEGLILLFSGFDKHRLQRLGMLADEVDLPAGKVLMRQGESGTDMMVIVSGSVAIERDGAQLENAGVRATSSARSH